MNSRIEELKRDNLELQQSLEEHHEMLDLIMSKYKQQTLQLESTESLEARSPVHNALKVSFFNSLTWKTSNRQLLREINQKN